MGDETECRAVRRAPVVVRDVPGYRAGIVGVPEPPEDLAQLLVPEQEEQHHRVGLFGDLVEVGILALRAQDPVEPLDVAVLRPVRVPVQFLEVLIALELADDPVVVERDEHPPAHVPPHGQFVVADAEPLAQLLRAARGQQRQQLVGDTAQPRHHDVGVCVVAQAAPRRVRVLVVELVRAHHAMDLVALALGIEVRDRCPEARDAEHHFRAIVAQERLVMGGLEVLPDVPEDRRVDVPLVTAEVRLPAARNGVEVDALGLLGPLASALPREHRAPESFLPGRRPGLAYPAVAVHQQPSRDLGQPDVEERKRVELIPEHMPAIRLPVQAAGG